MSLLDCTIDWAAPAMLKDRRMPTQGFALIGDHIYDGTIAGAIKNSERYLSINNGASRW
jgi:hypothetical protein